MVTRSGCVRRWRGPLRTGTSARLPRRCRARITLFAGRLRGSEQILLAGPGGQRDRVGGRAREAQELDREDRHDRHRADRRHAPSKDRADREAQRRPDPPGVRARALHDRLQREHQHDALYGRARGGEPPRRAGLHDHPAHLEGYNLRQLRHRLPHLLEEQGYDTVWFSSATEHFEEHRDEPFLATYLGVTGHHDYRPVDRYGFSFGEHDLYQHDNTIYEEGLGIPLIVHDPGRFRGGERVETLTNQLDILPTVFDLLGYEVADGEYPGRSLLAPPEKNRSLFFGCFDDYRCLASLKGTEKYIYFFGNSLDELYALSSEPLEKNNLADERISKEMRARRSEVLAWYTRVNVTYEESEPERR